MPTVASLAALERAAAEFEIGDTRLVIEPAALADDLALWVQAAGQRLAQPGQAARAPRPRPALRYRGDRPAAAGAATRIPRLTDDIRRP